MGIDRPRDPGLLPGCVTPLPYTSEQLASVLNLTAVSGEMLEQAELDRGQSQGLSITGHGFTSGIDAERPHAEHRLVLPLIAVTPKDCPEPQSQLASANRLRNEVVDAELEGDDPVDLARALRKDHRKGVSPLVAVREVPQQLGRRHVGRILVEQNDTRAPAAGTLEGDFAQRRMLDRDSLVAQELLELQGESRRRGDDADLEDHEEASLVTSVTAPCRLRVRRVRIPSPEVLVSRSFQSSRRADTHVDDIEVVQWVASAQELGVASGSGRASWPVALARSLRTAREAIDCAREIRRRPVGPGAIHRAERLVTACERLCERLRMEVAVRGRVPTGPCVIVANHLSYLDPLAVGWTLPVGAVAKSEIMRWPGVGEAVADLGVVFVERSSPHSGAVALRKMMRLLEDGVPVLVFPEGTTTTGEDVLPFSRGAFGVARLIRVPVVPATIRYDAAGVAWVGDASLIPHAVKLHRHRRIRAELAFGPELHAMAFPDASALAEATRQCIRSLLLP